MTPLPKLSDPALRALASINVYSLEDLTRFTKAELAALHGFGPASFKVLEPLLKKHKLELKHTTQ